jgi:hypothetical protein
MVIGSRAMKKLIIVFLAILTAAPAYAEGGHYYCAPAYLYVPSCPAGWQAVPATPPATLSAAPGGVPPQ